MSYREWTVQGSEVMAQLLDPGFADVYVVAVVSGGAPADVMYGTPGTGKTQIVLRLSMALTDPPAGAPSDPPNWATLVRNALVHESKLNRRVRHENPGIDVDTFLALLAEILATHQATLSANPNMTSRERNLTNFTRRELHCPARQAREPRQRLLSNIRQWFLDRCQYPEAADRLHVDVA